MAARSVRARKCLKSFIVTPFISFVLLYLDLILAREGGDVFAGSKRECLDGHGGLAPAGSDQAAAIADEQVRHIMAAMVSVDHRGGRVVAHAAGAEQVHRRSTFGHR